MGLKDTNVSGTVLDVGADNVYLNQSDILKVLVRSDSATSDYFAKERVPLRVLERIASFRLVDFRSVRWLSLASWFVQPNNLILWLRQNI